jgi:hypothetical protein
MGYFFFTRNIISSISSSVFIYISGQWLNKVLMPVNYQAMYAFGFIVSCLSLFFLIKVNSVKNVPQTLHNRSGFTYKSMFSFWKKFMGWPGCTHFTINTLILSWDCGWQLRSMCSIMFGYLVLMKVGLA